MTLNFLRFGFRFGSSQDVLETKNVRAILVSEQDERVVIKVGLMRGFTSVKNFGDIFRPFV